MVRVTILALAGATALAHATYAADLPSPLPPMMPQFVQPVPVMSTGGWYLRGDIGVGAQNFSEFKFTQTNVETGGAWPASWRIDQKDIKDTFLIGLGIGYQWNNWMRFDITGEYRADVKFKAVGSYSEFCPSGRCFDLYDGDHSATVFLANFYFDLGTWWCLTPFVGVGVGGAYHRTAALSDGNFPTGGFGYANADHANFDFAWAAHAGLSYTVTNNFKVEFSYRYLNMGSADTAEVLCGSSGCGTGGGPRAFYTLKGMDSHDFRIGMRWLLQPEAPPPPMFAPPLMRKG